MYNHVFTDSLLLQNSALLINHLTSVQCFVVVQNRLSLARGQLLLLLLLCSLCSSFLLTAPIPGSRIQDPGSSSALRFNKRAMTMNEPIDQRR